MIDYHIQAAERAAKQLRGGTATSIYRDDIGTTHVRYHQTNVVSMHPDGTATLRAGGWQTVTTKRRINQVSDAFNLGIRVFQKDHAWYVDSIDGTQPFEEGMVVRTVPKAWDGEAWRYVS